MQSSTTKSAYYQGLRTGTPFLLMAVPFATLFGVVATEAGLDLLQTMGFSALVIAGAAQFAALPLMVEHAPILVILATALAVNLRMAMYSAALVPHFGTAKLSQKLLIGYTLFDQNYSIAVNKFEDNPSMPLNEKLAYFVGVSIPIVPGWILGTAFGALVGEQIPPEYALDFALPITFLAIVGPALRTFAHVAAAFTSLCVALVFAFLPYNLGLMIAAITAMAVGARIELWLEGQKS